MLVVSVSESVSESAEAVTVLEVEVGVSFPQKVGAVVALAAAAE